MSKEWAEKRVEQEATAPGGGFMTWTVHVSEPSRELGECTAMVGIVEDTTLGTYGQDKILLGVEDAEWLAGALTRAVTHARQVEREATIAEYFDGKPPTPETCNHKLFRKLRQVVDRKTFYVCTGCHKVHSEASVA